MIKLSARKLLKRKSDLTKRLGSLIDTLERSKALEKPMKLMERLNITLTNKDYFYILTILLLLTFKVDLNVGLYPIVTKDMIIEEVDFPEEEKEEIPVAMVDHSPIPEEKTPPAETKPAPKPPPPPVVSSFSRVVDHLARTDSKAAGYVSIFHSTAKAEQKRFGIPASITLAQGILESDRGGSYLARKANNHFGIKYYGMTRIPKGLRKHVKGYVIRHDDCRPNHYWAHENPKGYSVAKRSNGQLLLCPKPDKYVKYETAWSSYRHHSYIVMKSRYTKYNPVTYNEWAYALRRGGYATDKNYHKKIIRLIAKHRLQELDDPGS